MTLMGGERLGFFANQTQLRYSTQYLNMPILVEESRKN